MGGKQVYCASLQMLSVRDRKKIIAFSLCKQIFADAESDFDEQS